MDVFGSSGTRGPVTEVTPAFATRVARAAVTTWDAERIAVARDTRTTGELLTNAVAAGAASAGADVDRLGVQPTPSLQVHAERAGVPGVVVTASHNPPADNGIKLYDDTGHELSPDAYDAVADEFGSARRADWDAVGDTRHVEDAGQRYAETVCDALDRTTIANANLRVAVDPGHGAGAATTPTILRRLGCSVVTTNAQPDGRFPGRDPEPVAEHLGDLRRLVRAADADVGVAHDGDADRAVFVDETGATIPPESSFAAFAAAAVGSGDTLVSAVNVSQRVVDAVESAGGQVDLTPIGSAYIFARVRELERAGERVPVAGEGNGGVAFPPYRLARDGAYIAGRFLELVAERPASDVAAAHADYHSVRENVAYATDAEREAMLDAAERMAAESDAQVTTIDGYRLDFGDGWVLARPSGTEPLVRVYAEAGSEARAEELLARMADPLRAARG
ncbi:MAG: phosphoglucosamine mutase [Halobacteriaceae archaeon]